MPETDNVEVACIQAAVACATNDGIDSDTRDAANQYLRRQWEYDANEEQPSDNPGGAD